MVMVPEGKVGAYNISLAVPRLPPLRGEGLDTCLYKVDVGINWVSKKQSCSQGVNSSIVCAKSDNVGSSFPYIKSQPVLLTGSLWVICDGYNQSFNWLIIIQV